MAMSSRFARRGDPRFSGEENRGGSVLAPVPAAQARRLSNDSGQAVLEYILLLSIIVGIYATVSGWASSYGLAQKMISPISKDFAAIYQFGDPKAAGFESDSPKHHPRIEDCEGCFRLFINPSIKK